MQASAARPFVAALALFAALCLRGGPLAAQQLRGTVRDSASRTPIPGAVLMLLDSGGRAIGRNITNERGDYALALDPAMRNLQVLRIGFRPRTLPIPTPHDGVASLDVAMTVVPMMLESVRIIDQPNCPRRADRPAAFALWEQAKAGLLATVVAREASRANVLRVQYVRRFGRGDQITSQTVRMDSATTSRPFASARSAAEFVERGFTLDSAGLTWFAGPDADVMLDDAFARGYCFSLAAADKARPTQVGLAFAAANHRRGRVEIEGAVWIDTASRTLTDVVFRYVGLPRELDRLRPGGHIWFRAMENGAVIIDRWFLRTAEPAPLPQRRVTPNELVNRRLIAREAGGEVARVRWPDGRGWQATLGTLRARVSDGGVAEIRLVDTDYAAKPGADGVFEIADLVPGPYTIGVVDTALAKVDLMLLSGTKFTAARDSTIDLSIDAPTAHRYALDVCGETVGASGVLVALVLLPDGRPAENARVEVRAQGELGITRVADGTTDAQGLFHLCSAPPNAALVVRAERDGTTASATTAETRHRITTVKIRLGSPTW